MLYVPVKRVSFNLFILFLIVSGVELWAPPVIFFFDEVKELPLVIAVWDFKTALHVKWCSFVVPEHSRSLLNSHFYFFTHMYCI